MLKMYGFSVRFLRGMIRKLKFFIAALCCVSAHRHFHGPSGGLPWPGAALDVFERVAARQRVHPSGIQKVSIQYSTLGTSLQPHACTAGTLYPGGRFFRHDVHVNSLKCSHAGYSIPPGSKRAGAVARRRYLDVRDCNLRSLPILPWVAGDR